MKTIVCQKPNQFEMLEKDEPVCANEEVLIKIKRIGICGTDLHAYKGNQPFFNYPRVLGHELSGEVLQTGNSVEDIQIGDYVAVLPYISCKACTACKNQKPNCCENIEVIGVHRDGGMAEKLCVPSGNIVKANDVTLEESAVLEPLSISHHALERAALETPQTILVIGAGPIGLGVMAFAKQKGHTVIAMDLNPERLRFAKEWAKVDEATAPTDDTINKLAKLNGGELPSTVFEATGNQHSMTNAFEYVSHGGKLIYVGLVKQNISFFDPDFHKKELTLLGSRNATLNDFQVVKEAISNGNMNITSYITHQTTFDQLIDVYEDWYNPEENVIKAMVKV